MWGAVPALASFLLDYHLKAATHPPLFPGRGLVLGCCQARCPECSRRRNSHPLRGPSCPGQPAVNAVPTPPPPYCSSSQLGCVRFLLAVSGPAVIRLAAGRRARAGRTAVRCPEPVRWHTVPLRDLPADQVASRCCPLAPCQQGSFPSNAGLAHLRRHRPYLLRVRRIPRHPRLRQGPRRNHPPRPDRRRRPHRPGMAQTTTRGHIKAADERSASRPEPVLRS